MFRRVWCQGTTVFSSGLKSFLREDGSWFWTYASARMQSYFGLVSAKMRTDPFSSILDMIFTARCCNIRSLQQSSPPIFFWGLPSGSTPGVRDPSIFQHQKKMADSCCHQWWSDKRKVHLPQFQRAREIQPVLPPLFVHSIYTESLPKNLDS